MKIFLLLVLLTSGCIAESLKEIAGLLEDRQYQRAESALQAGLKVHPESALGWYYFAQDEYFLGKLDPARRALSKAKGLDPSLFFASRPEDFYRLQRQLFPNSGSSAVLSSNNQGSNGSWIWSILLVAGGLLFVGVIFSLISAFRRRSVGYPINGGASPMSSGMPYPPPSYGSPGGGIGTFVGGMAAGALADELLRPRTEVIREEIITNPDQNQTDRPTFDPGNTNQDWSGNSGGSGFDSGGGSSDSNSW